ncbi:2309_t:CDS:2, partial [Ambispora leptoticha]
SHCQNHQNQTVQVTPASGVGKVKTGSGGIGGGSLRIGNANANANGNKDDYPLCCDNNWCIPESAVVTVNTALGARFALMAASAALRTIHIIVIAAGACLSPGYVGF